MAMLEWEGVVGREFVYDLQSCVDACGQERFAWLGRHADKSDHASDLTSARLLSFLFFTSSFPKSPVKRVKQVITGAQMHYNYTCAVSKDLSLSSSITPNH